MLHILTSIDTYLYYPVLLIILALAAIFFTIRTRFVQVRMFGEACRCIAEKPQEEGALSSFQALMVSTASRVGTGNIVGVSTAICLGGAGAVFWMWLLALLGAASAFIETTLAQIYKRKDPKTGEYFGGPAYYIEHALHNRVVAVIFIIFLILTYGFGFQLLCSYNVQTTFQTYSFYDTSVTPWVVGAVLAFFVGLVLFGGGKRIAHVSSALVPFMGIMYVVASLVVIFAHVRFIPAMFAWIFRDAFNFRAIGSGVVPTAANSGAPYVQQSLSSVFGRFGPIFITVSMLLFAFTTLIGNLFYVDNAVTYLNHKKEPSRRAMNWIHLACVIVVFLGAVTPMDAAWAAADISMGGMAIINIPCCIILGSKAIAALKDYERQKKAGHDPHFYASNIKINKDDLECWLETPPEAVSEHENF